MFVWLNNNTNGLSFGAGILGFSVFRVARLLVLATIFYSSLLILLTIVLSVLLRFTASASYYPLPLVSSDYPIGIFWLPHWYLMITPLISSDYPIGILWLSHWYLLITPFVSSDYPFDIFKLFFRVLMSTSNNIKRINLLVIPDVVLSWTVTITGCPELKSWFGTEIKNTINL